MVSKEPLKSKPSIRHVHSKFVFFLNMFSDPDEKDDERKIK